MGYVDAAHAAEGDALAACRARRAAAGAGRAVAVRSDPLLPRLTRSVRRTHEPMSADSASPRTTNGSGSEGDVAVIGITDYAQSQLGDVVYVELPEIGRRSSRARRRRSSNR